LPTHFAGGIEQQCLGVHLFAAGPAFGREVRIPGELQRYFFDHCGMMQMLRKVAPVSHEIAVVSTEPAKA